MKLFNRGSGVENNPAPQPNNVPQQGTTQTQPNTNNVPNRNGSSNNRRFNNRGNRRPSGSNTNQGPNQNSSNPRNGNRGGNFSRNNSRGNNQNNRRQGNRFQNNQRNNGMRAPKQDRKQVYYTANALKWGNNSSYNFHNEDPSKTIRIIPIAGLDKVGTNCTLIEYENDILIIDAGIGFPGQSLPGVDGTIPNLSYLNDKKDRIRGLVITHGHMDHIGGIHHVIDKIGFPTIYAPRLAAGLIRERLKETDFANSVKIVEYDGDSTYYLGKFHISHFKMTHTIPDNFGISIETPVGRIVTPSDFKFDLSPYKESPSDYAKLAKMGDEGILLLLHESTNAHKAGWSAAETDIAEDLENIIRSAKGRLMIGMFSTMVNRIRQVIELADRHHKKIAVLGRSLENIVKISHGLGYINVLNSIFVPFDQIGNIPDDQLIIITTGSQGEPNAALMRMATDQHQKITLKPSDTIVFSSSQIPGNEAQIENLINLLTLHGCKVLISDYLTLHASGHGNREEHKLMLQLTKPKYILPIHGDAKMRAALKDTAKGLGYEDQNVVMVENGYVVEVNSSGWQVKDTIDCAPLWVEGNRVGDFDAEIVEERKALTDEGVVLVSITNIQSAEFNPSNVEVLHKGFFIQTSDKFLTKTMVNGIVEHVKNLKDKEKELVRSAVRRYVENEITREYGKKVIIAVSVV